MSVARAAPNRMTTRGAQLLGAMRINLELLVELEKTAPDDVVAIVEALVAHLKSWKPMQASSVASVDTGPVPRIEPLPAANVADVERVIKAGRYRVHTEAGALVLSVRDDGDDVVLAFEPDEAATFETDVSAARAGLERQS